MSYNGTRMHNSKRISNLQLQASEKVYFIKSDSQIRTKSDILERTIYFEVIRQNSGA
ncbi:MAG: hypothetical protein M3P28_10080 [Thermoproteota archaeon]|nr:hypothetical protein [Thermoproteota archaeon]